MGKAILSKKLKQTEIVLFRSWQFVWNHRPILFFIRIIKWIRFKFTALIQCAWWEINQIVTRLLILDRIFEPQILQQEVPQICSRSPIISRRGAEETWLHLQNFFSMVSVNTKFGLIYFGIVFSGILAQTTTYWVASKTEFLFDFLWPFLPKF